MVLKRGCVLNFSKRIAVKISESVRDASSPIEVFLYRPSRDWEERVRRALSNVSGFSGIQSFTTWNLAALPVGGPVVVTTSLSHYREAASSTAPHLANRGDIGIVAIDPGLQEGAVKEALLLGCRGHLLETVSDETISRALYAVAQGEYWAPRSVVSGLLTSALAVAQLPDLTPREQDVLRLLAEDLKNRDIAEELGVHRDTVRWYLKSLYQKLGVTNRLSAIQWGQKVLEYPLRSSQDPPEEDLSESA